MAYTIDKNLEAGMNMLAEGKKIDSALKLINKSARKGTTKGKSFFEVGKIIHDGVPGLEANPEESRKYYDASVNQFMKENRDSMDNRELGDYYYYGLGTEPVNVEKALEYYDLSAKDGDKEAQAKADEIRKNQLQNKIVAVAPEEESKEAEVKPVEEPVAEAAPKAEPSVAETAPVAPVAETPVAPVAEEAKVEKAPVVAPVNGPAEVTGKDTQEQVQEDALLIRAIRLIDNPSSTYKDRMDGIELAKTASDQGSLRAAVLLGFLYEGENSLVEKDMTSSKKYYELAMSRGSASAEFRLGRLYLDHSNAFFDEDKAHQLILDSAHKGYSYALNYLGDCFREKVSDPKNLELAYRYYSLAGERGLGLSYHNMAEIDASRQQLDLAKTHESYAAKFGYDTQEGLQDPLSLSIHR